MRSSHLLWLLPCGLVALLFSVHSAPRPEKPSLGYVERITGGAAKNASLPLVIAVHGLGDTPEAFAELYADFDTPARVIAPRAPDPWNDGFSWYPFRGDAAQKRAAIRARTDDLAALIGYARTARPTTRDKVLVTGFSQGGVMSFAVAAYHPALIAAALPIAGTFDPSMPELEPFSGPLPIFAFHGRSDELIPFATAEAAATRFRKAGRDVTLTGYDGVGHQIPPNMRRDYFAALRTALRD